MLLSDACLDFMSEKTLTTPHAKHALPRVAFLARVVLHACVLLVVTLLPCTTLCLGLPNVTESESPAGPDELSEEKAVCLQVRTRVVRNQPSSPLQVPVRGGFSRVTSRLASLPHSGHRLPNHLLAPLRC
jgi:hypothetical protein